MWAIISGTIKAFRFSFDYVLYDISYTNIALLGATLPSYGSGTRRGGPKGRSRLYDDEVIDADDPKNRERVHLIFNEFG